MEEFEGALLTESIDIRSLLTTGAKFGIKNDNYKDNEDLIDILDEDDADLGAPVQSPWKKSFQELRKSMTKLPDWNIYKRITTEGTGEPLKNLRARVTYHYNFFVESAEEAFDSSFLRRTKVVMYSYDGNSLPGTLAALCTMRKGEEAEFVINYELMFGKLGSPPRVPPEADILMVAQMLNIEDVGDEKAIESLPDEDRKKFPHLEERAIEVMKKANDLCKQGRYSKAARNYHSIASSLNFCNLVNEDEQAGQQALLAKIYVRLMDVYIKMEDWQKTCSMFNELKTIPSVDIDKHFEAQLNLGIALGKLGQFNKSLEHLRKAQRIQPHNEDVNKHLKIVIETKIEKQSEERNFCMRAFNIIQRIENPNTE